MAKKKKTAKHGFPDELFVQARDDGGLEIDRTEEDAATLDDTDLVSCAGHVVGVYKLVEVVKLERTEPAYKRVPVGKG